MNHVSNSKKPAILQRPKILTVIWRDFCCRNVLSSNILCLRKIKRENEHSKKDWHTLSPPNKGSKFQELIISFSRKSKRINFRAIILKSVFCEWEMEMTILRVIYRLWMHCASSIWIIKNGITWVLPNFSRFYFRTWLEIRNLYVFDTCSVSWYSRIAVERYQNHLLASGYHFCISELIANLIKIFSQILLW